MTRIWPWLLAIHLSVGGAAPHDPLVGGAALSSLR